MTDMSSYTSNRVFEGRRVLTDEQAERHRERLKRALDRRKNDMSTETMQSYDAIGPPCGLIRPNTKILLKHKGILL